MKKKVYALTFDLYFLNDNTGKGYRLLSVPKSIGGNNLVDFLTDILDNVVDENPKCDDLILTSITCIHEG